ncbi:hypothetical protein EDC04DRAFT_2904894 [Pisolithus marmoratus]|nr:hypothetical protein EDC04DRAFT_2904894 [Pisolithus marmoratus]
MEALQALMASDRDVDDEFYSSPSASFEVESMKQKKLKDKCMEANMHEPDMVKNTTECVGPKRQCEIGPEDKEPISVKAQKLIKHEGRPHAKDYDNVTQEFVTATVAEYHAQLCAQSPMPDHGQETMLLVASWAKAHQLTGMNLAQTPDLSKLICDHQLWFTGAHSQSKSTIKTNQMLAEALKEGTNFAFKHMVPTEEG